MNLYLDQLKYISELIEHLSKNPLPEGSYVDTMIVIKESDTDNQIGRVAKDETGEYRFES